MFKKYLKCGTIRPDRSDKTLKYEVRSIEDLIRKVIPHFRKYPLLSGKIKDFCIFSEVCWKMYDKEHLTSKGFKEIIKMALVLNPLGRKKFPRAKIEI